MASSTGSYEIALDAYVTTTVATDFQVILEINEASKRFVTGSALATSSIGYPLIWNGCVNQGQNISATIDSNSANTINYVNASMLSVTRKSTTCY